ncbi:MAG: hypothetical protein ACRC2T_15040, partial [Thermoguttaceae bacterium]
MIFIGNIIMATLFWLSYSLCPGSSGSAYIDFRAMLTFGVPLVIYAGFYFKEFALAKKIFFTMKFQPVYGDEVKQYEKTAKVFAILASACAIYGFLAMLIGVAMMLQENLNPISIGNGLAFGILSFMYSAYLGIFVFLPISLRCSS